MPLNSGRGVIASAMLQIPNPFIPSTRQALAQFLDALFTAEQLVELRLIESWTEGGKKRSRLIERFWNSPSEVVARYAVLDSFNKAGANIYFGVNPRAGLVGTKTAVIQCQSVWVDFDQMSIMEAECRWQQVLPRPSVLVSSGHGIHAYWLLERACSIMDPTDRESYELMLQRLYRQLGADTVQDVSRCLRLPPFWNVKGFRHGIPSVPCKILECDSQRRYSLATFQRWLPEEPFKQSSPALPTAMFTSRSRTTTRIRALMQKLELATPDRSRRDFAVVCGLLRLGCTADEIWAIVRDRSKFQSDGVQYFERTLRNARQVTGASD
jgi:hypothetical protein